MSNSLAQQVANSVAAQQNLRTPGDITFYVDDYCWEFGIDEDTATEASMILHRQHGFEV